MTKTKNIIISDRYSNALVSLAQEGKLTYGKIESDLNLIKEILSQSKDLNECLTNPVISIKDKKEIIDKVFSEGIDSLIINFIKVLVDKNRFDTFEEVVISFSKALDNINNLSRVTVTSAVKMSEESKQKLKEKLENKLKKSVVLDLDIDSSIIAGLIIKIGDNVIDMSLKHKLEDLSKTLTK